MCGTNRGDTGSIRGQSVWDLCSTGKATPSSSSSSSSSSTSVLRRQYLSINSALYSYFIHLPSMLRVEIDSVDK
jgi:hypothetical protein